MITYTGSTSKYIILELRELYVCYYRDLNILQNLNIKARENQITAILGANGGGKSTALKAVFGFLRPFATLARLVRFSRLQPKHAVVAVI